MRLLFAGTPASALPPLQKLLAAEHDIVAVLSQPAAAKGRSKELRDSEVAEFAKQNGLPLFTPTKISEISKELTALKLDLGVTVAYGQLLPKTILDIPALGWINLHYSLLPAWRGAAPVQRSIMAGDEISGVSVFQLDEGMDTGPILSQATTAIDQNESAGELLVRLSEIGADLLVKTVDGISGSKVIGRAQSSEGKSFAPKLSSTDAKIDWKLPALVLHRLIRGCTPTPGAHCSFAGQRIEVDSSELVETETQLPPGMILGKSNQVLVGTGSQPIVIGRVKPAGKNWMAATDWLRGIRTEMPQFDVE